MILQAIAGLLLVSERGDSESILFCSGCIPDNDFEEPLKAYGLGSQCTHYEPNLQ